MPDTAWVPVKPEEFARQPRSEPYRGVEFTILVSPYDIPEAIRGRYDTRRGRFVIEFKYIQQEEWEPEDREFVTLRLGKNSGRLLGAEIDVDQLGANFVKLNLGKLLEERISKLQSERRKLATENYQIALKVIDRNEARVVAELEPA